MDIIADLVLSPLFQVIDLRSVALT